MFSKHYSSLTYYGKPCNHRIAEIIGPVGAMFAKRDTIEKLTGIRIVEALDETENHALAEKEVDATLARTTTTKHT